MCIYIPSATAAVCNMVRTNGRSIPIPDTSTSVAVKPFGAAMASASEGATVADVGSMSIANYMFIVPVFLSLIVIIVVCIAILRSISDVAKKGKPVAVALLSFGSVLGLTYIFGALAFVTGNFAFELIFAIGVGVQGLLIFYFHVYRHEEFRKGAADKVSQSRQKRRGSMLQFGKRSTNTFGSSSSAGTSAGARSSSSTTSNSFMSNLEHSIVEVVAFENPIYDGDDDGESYGGGNEDQHDQHVQHPHQAAIVKDTLPAAAPPPYTAKVVEQKKQWPSIHKLKKGQLGQFANNSSDNEEDHVVLTKDANVNALKSADDNQHTFMLEKPLRRSSKGAVEKK